ncbi:coagulation factor XIII A chain-like [Gasterosteus aculeatus]
MMASQETKPPRPYRGRYRKPLATTNLDEIEEDFPEFEAFDNDLTPRAVAPDGDLSVNGVDMMLQSNSQKHFTKNYEVSNLVVRRGQEFTVRVTFSRPLTQGDDFQLEFLIGAEPTVNKGSMVVVTFGSRPGSWAGRILDQQGPSVVLGVTATARAIVGKFRTYVAVVVGGGMKRTKRNPETDMYLLFNAWCPEDPVYLFNAGERGEYVLNDYGVIYQGSAGAVVHREWIYGQFERGILDACISILDASRMPIHDRGDVIKVVRKGSAMVNSQDDNGVLVGNWSDDYSLGQSPTSWTGSVQILLQYANTGVSVSFAQCWVFAGVFNTFLRAIGIPARVITNFNSAHDNTGNLKTDLIFNPDGTPDERNTRDSIWNYHCWNEVWIARDDVPPAFMGWQVVDATPQETSDGHFRCGPASVNAIKEGILCHPFDSGFVFAEVNSDVVFHKKDKFGTLTPYRVEKTIIGTAIYTKAVGANQPSDITQTYKYQEGSREDEATMKRAEEYGCERDHSEVSHNTMTVDVEAKQIMVGEDVDLKMIFSNNGAEDELVQANLACSIIFYTGVTSTHFKEHSFTFTVPANEIKTEALTIKAGDYMPHLGSQVSLHFIVTGKSDDQSVTAIKVLTLQKPQLSLRVSGTPSVWQWMFLTVTYTNNLSFTLKNVTMMMEGTGTLRYRQKKYSSILPRATVSWTESFQPQRPGNSILMAVMDCDNLSQVIGSTYVTVRG